MFGFVLFSFRVRFMLEIIINLRSNNLRKILGYDFLEIEYFRKILRLVIRELGKLIGINYF